MTLANNTEQIVFTHSLQIYVLVAFVITYPAAGTMTFELARLLYPTKHQAPIASRALDALNLGERLIDQNPSLLVLRP